MADIGTPSGFRPRVGGGFEAIPAAGPGSGVGRLGGGRRGGRAAPSRPGEPLPSIPAGVTSITRPQRGGGTITVTRSGKVTRRDARGALIERFQTTEREARSFIASPQTQSERAISDLKRRGIKATIGTRGEIITFDPITGRRTVEEPSRLGVTRKGTIGVKRGQVLVAGGITSRLDPAVVSVRRQREEGISRLKEEAEQRKITKQIKELERTKGFTIAGRKTRAARITEKIAGFQQKVETALTFKQETSFRKLGLIPNIKERNRLKREGTFVEKAGRYGIELAKAVGRLPTEIAGIPFVIGGRAAIGAAALFDKEKRKILTGAFKEVPEAIVTMHDPREPEGLLQIILTLVAVRGIAKSKSSAAQLGDDVSKAKVIAAEVKVSKPVGNQVTITKKGVVRIGGKNIKFFEKRVVHKNRVPSVLKKGARLGDFVVTKRTLNQIKVELQKAKVKPIKKVKESKTETRVITRLKPKARAKLERAKQRLAKPIRAARVALDITKEKVNIQTKRFVRRTQTTLGNLDIQIKFRKFFLEQTVKSITTQSMRKVNIRILKIKRIIRLGKEGVSSKIRIQINAINNILKKFNYKLRVEALRLKGLKAKLAKPILKAGRIIRISGTKISKVNTKVITKVRNNLGNLGIRVSFTKFRAKAKILDISSSARRNINVKLLRIKRQIRLSKNKITQPILSNINSIKNSLQRFNIRMRVIKLRIKEKVSAIKPKVVRAIRKPIRISGEALSQVNAKVIRSVRTNLGNLDIRVKFTKFRIKNRISDISSTASRSINRRIRLIRRGIRLSKNKITQPIISNINSISNSLKVFNIRMRVIKLRIGQRISAAKPKVIRAIRKPIRISGEALSNVNNRIITGVKTNLGNLGIRISFTKNRLKVKIKNISSTTSRSINRRVLLIRRSLRLSKNKITRPIISGLNSIRNSLRNFNIKMKFIKYRVGQRIGELKPKVVRKVTKPIRIGKQILTTTNAKVIRNIKTNLGNLGIRIRFIRAGKIKTITQSVVSKINRNIILIQRALRISKNKVTRPIINNLNTIKTSFNKFNVKIKFTKFKVGQVLKETRLLKVPKKIVGKVIRTKRQIFIRINKNLNRVNTSLKTINIRIKFKTFKIRQRINRLTEPLELKINRNLRVLRRQLINSKGRITKVVRKTVKSINNIIPIEIKIIKVKPITGRRLLVKGLKAKGAIEPGLIRNVDILRRKVVSNLLRQRKAVRRGGVIRKGKRVFEFEDLITGKTRFFTSRKQFLKAIKQQVKLVKSTQGKQGLIENIVRINRNLREATKVKKVGTRLQRVGLEQQRRLLRRQQAVEGKLARGLQIKASRIGEGVIRNGKRVFPFLDKSTGKINFFTSRKKWLRAIKQQAKELPKRKFTDLNNFFKLVPKELVAGKIIKFDKPFRVIPRPKASEIFRAKPPEKLPLGTRPAGRQLLLLEKTKSQTTSKQAKQIPSSQRLVTVTKQKQVAKKISATRQKLILKLKPSSKTVSVSKTQSLAEAVSLFKGLNALLLGKTQLASVLLGQTALSKQVNAVSNKVKQAQAQISKQLSAQAQAQSLNLAVAQISLTLQAQLSAQANLLRRILRTKQKTKLIPKQLKLKLVPPIFPDDEKKKNKLKKLIGRVIPRQRFIYINDLYSAIYNIKANPAEKRAFLKVGRVFTGAEARLIVRR